MTKRLFTVLRRAEGASKDNVHEMTMPSQIGNSLFKKTLYFYFIKQILMDDQHQEPTGN